jgi:hypothetical protein
VARNTPFARLLTDLIEPYQLMDLDRTNYDTDLAALVNATTAARTGPANAFLTPAILGALPADANALPARDLALTSRTPFDLTPFNVEPSLRTLRGLAAGARPNDAAAAVAIDVLADELQSVGEDARMYAAHYEALRQAAQQTVDYVVLEAREVTVSLGSSVLGADLVRSVYVSLDAGIAYPWRLENMVFYAGTNIYFRPINKAAPLRYKETFLHRFALTIGVTTTVKDDSRRAIDLRPTQDNTQTSNSLLIGGGLRVTPSIRIGGGVLVFKESDPNPTIKQTSVTATPYIGLAADVDVAAVLKSFFP